MLGHIGSNSQFALAVLGNLGTFCFFIYIMLLSEKAAKSALRTCFKLQLPTLMLLVVLTAALLSANLRPVAHTGSNSEIRELIYGFPADAVAISRAGHWDIRGWDLLVNLSTAFGLSAPLLIACEVGLRRRRGLNFEEALQTVPAVHAPGTELTRSPVNSSAAPIRARTAPAARWKAPESTQGIRNYPMTIGASLLLLVMVGWIKQAWKPWIVAQTFPAEDRAVDTTGVCALNFCPDGAHFIAGFDDGRMGKWDLNHAERLASYFGNTAPVKSIVFSDKGGFFTTQSADGAARLWNDETAAEVRNFGCDKAPTASCAAPSDTGAVLVAYSDNSLRLYTTDGRLERTFLGHGGKLNWVRFLPGEQSAICANWRGLMQLWDFSQVPTYAATQPIDLKYDSDECVRLWDTNDILLKGDTKDLIQAFRAESSPWLMTLAHHGRVAQWSVATGREIRSVPDLLPNVVSAACTDDGKSLITLDERNAWQEWRYEPTATLPSHASDVRTAEISPDRTEFVTASRDGTARVWDARNGRERMVLGGNTAALLAARFTPDSKRVVTVAEDGAIRVFDKDSPDALVCLAGDARTQRSAAISSDGQRALFVRTDGTVRVCALDPARELGIFPSPSDAANPLSQCTVAQFDPGSHDIVAGRRDGSLQLWHHAYEWPGGLLNLWQFGVACWLVLLALFCAYFERRAATRSL